MLPLDKPNIQSPWFVSGTRPNPEAKWRLFCFPFAGGSGHEFRQWGRQLDTVDVYGVLYPGRASRYATPLIDNIAGMVSAVQQELAAFQDKPFAFFGHSLGGLIAFELTRSLRRAGLPLPQLLCVSAGDAPHLLPLPPILHNLPDKAFVDAIRDFGGTPEVVLEHQELLAMTLPILRADIKALETYQYQEEDPLNIPLYAVGGLVDTVVKRENILAWQQHGSAEWETQFFPGGHFYYRDDPNGPLFAYLRRILSQQMNSNV
jgi:medium-chain acyl-[acyl-carrier-protein] hydrolase